MRIDVPSNWIYQAGDPSPDISSEEEGELDGSNHPTYTTIEEDVIPRPTLPSQYEAGSSKANQDWWVWVQSEIHGM